MTGIRVGRDNREKSRLPNGSLLLVFPNRIEPWASITGFFISQKFILSLSGPNTHQDHRRYPDSRVFGKKL